MRTTTMAISRRGAVVNGELRDLSAAITGDATVAIVTAKADDPNALYLCRHSAAHVMAEAITRLYPQTKLAYGPPVDNGFFYDLELEKKLTVDEFAKIDAEIQKILAEDRPFTRYEVAKDAAFEKLNKENFGTNCHLTTISKIGKFSIRFCQFNPQMSSNFYP